MTDKINYVSKVSVEPLTHAGDDLFVANVARVSFNKWKEEFDEKDARLLDFLAREEHTSPFRHTFLSVRCSVPVFLARQLAKHQAGFSWNEVSRRYVDKGFEFYKPEQWHYRPADGIKQGRGSAVSPYHKTSLDAFMDYSTVRAINAYDMFINAGVAPEEARMLLPQNMMVDYVWSGNLYGFFHLWRLRSKPNAQLVAQEFAQEIDTICKDLFPVCWEALTKNSI